MSETGGAAAGVREVKSAARTVEPLELLAARGTARQAVMRETRAGVEAAVPAGGGSVHRR